MKLLTLIGLILLPLLAISQQDPQFNQYMFNPLGVNPAYAGSRDALSLQLLSRNQWLGVEGAPTTQTFSAHTPLWKKKIGVGLQLMNESIGPKNNVSIMATYAYRIRLFSGRLAFGLRGGYANYQINWNDVDFRDNNDPLAQQGTESYLLPNFDFGMYYHTSKFFLGAEAAHLNSPQFEFIADSTNVASKARLQPHSSFLAGRAFVLNENLTFRPVVLYKQAGLTPGFLDMNANFLIRDALWLGAGYRTGFGGILIAEYVVKRKFRIGYSYDFALQRFRGYTGGSHEIFIGYDFNITMSRIVSPRVFF